jgi:phage-related protein
MLFEVNETIMGGKWQKFNFSDLIKAMREIISSIIREIRDLIVQELLKMVLKVLSPIIATLTTAILREQIENYTEAIDEIIRNCASIWFRMGNSQDNSDSKLDIVDYADIDTSTTKEGQSPQLKNC